MALAGRALLAIWNGIAEEAEADFLAWHVREHIPERVAVPGFLRARRYVAPARRAALLHQFYETAHRCGPVRPCLSLKAGQSVGVDEEGRPPLPRHIPAPCAVARVLAGLGEGPLLRRSAWRVGAATPGRWRGRSCVALPSGRDCRRSSPAWRHGGRRAGDGREGPARRAGPDGALGSCWWRASRRRRLNHSWTKGWRKSAGRSRVLSRARARALTPPVRARARPVGCGGKLGSERFPTGRFEDGGHE